MNKYDAALELGANGVENGDEFAVSTSEYNDMDYFRRVAREQNQRVMRANAQTMLGYLKRGWIGWEQSYRSGVATVRDVDAIRDFLGEREAIIRQQVDSKADETVLLTLTRGQVACALTALSAVEDRAAERGNVQRAKRYAAVYDAVRQQSEA